MSQEQRTANTIIRRIRSDLKDQTEPYFWSDEDLLSYIDEAQIEFCRRDVGAPITDSVTREVCEIPYKADDTVLPAHSSIFNILHAFRDDDDGTGRLYPLKIMTETTLLGAHNSADDYGMALSGATSFSQASRVRVILLDHTEGAIRLGSPADAAGILRIRVERGPIREICKPTDHYEVHRNHETALKAYSNYLAYSKQDAETFDEKARDHWKGEFDRIAARAQLEYIRRQSTPGPIQCKFP